MKARSQISKKTSQSAAQQVQPSLRSRPFAPPLKPEAEQAPLDLQTQLENAQRFGHHFGQYRISPHASALPPIQPKLTIGAPGDKYEQEADRVAKQVVQQLNAPLNKQSEQSVQRETLPEEEEELQMKPLADRIQRVEMPEEEEELQMKPDVLQRETLPEDEDEDELQMKSMVQRSSNGALPASEDLESAIAQSRGRGQPLVDTIRQPMEQSFGADFSRVRIHADTQADQLNRSIQARAFTTGQDVFFRQGAYQPGSRGGLELLAHELTHVVQQESESRQPTRAVDVGKREGEETNKEGETISIKGYYGEEEKRKDRSVRQETNRKYKASGLSTEVLVIENGRAKPLLQRKLDEQITPNKLNVVGEFHDESNNTRTAEKTIAKNNAKGDYWKENEFKVPVKDKRLMRGTQGEKGADPTPLRISQIILVLSNTLKEIKECRNSKKVEKKGKIPEKAIELLDYTETLLQDYIEHRELFWSLEKDIQVEQDLLVHQMEARTREFLECITVLFNYEVPDQRQQNEIETIDKSEKGKEERDTKIDEENNRDSGVTHENYIINQIEKTSERKAERNEIKQQKEIATNDKSEIVIEERDTKLDEEKTRDSGVTHENKIIKAIEKTREKKEESSDIKGRQKGVSNRAERKRKEAEMKKKTIEINKILKAMRSKIEDMRKIWEKVDKTIRTQKYQGIRKERSKFMHDAANTSEKRGIWKVGEYHVEDMEKLGKRSYALMSREQFRRNYENELQVNQAISSEKN